jgi:hypothetical protein
VLRSSIANNRAGVDGGGIKLLGIASQIVNSTVVGNESINGGGIALSSAATLRSRVISSTIVGNTANGDGIGGGLGGGIYATLGIIDLANSVVADNFAAELGPDCHAFSDELDSSGFNLIQSAAGCTFPALASDQVGVAAQLAVTANNGGPVAGSSLGVISGMPTRAPLTGSPLVDAGDVGGCRDAVGALLPTDQIGRARAVDGPDPDTLAECDIGAIEFVETLFADGFEAAP